jgi:hypothetical protein
VDDEVVKSNDKDECRNLNSFLDHPLEPGDTLAVTAAYCFFIQPTVPGNYYLASTGKAENNYTTTTLLEIEVVEDENDVQNKLIQDRLNKPTPAILDPTIGKNSIGGKISTIINDLFE